MVVYIPLTYANGCLWPADCWDAVLICSVSSGQPKQRGAAKTESARTLGHSAGGLLPPMAEQFLGASAERRTDCDFHDLPRACSVAFLDGARALGRHWRLDAGPSKNHKLVRTGPDRLNGIRPIHPCCACC
jgi:hypothetical protein